MSVEVNGGYSHTKFEKCRYSNECIKAKVKFLHDTARQTYTDDYTDSHFFHASQKAEYIIQNAMFIYYYFINYPLSAH